MKQEQEMRGKKQTPIRVEVMKTTTTRPHNVDEEEEKKQKENNI